MMDNHQDPHNLLQQLPRRLITILYSNMQSCWQPIKRQLSTHIPRRIPSGLIFSGLLPQYSCQEKRHAILPLVNLANPTAQFWENGHRPAVTSLCLASWKLGGEFIMNARCHGLLRPSGWLIYQIFPVRAPWEDIDDWHTAYSFIRTLTPWETEKVSQEMLSINKLFKRLMNVVIILQLNLP